MKSDRDIILDNIRKSLANSRNEIANDDALDSNIQEKLSSITPENYDTLIEQFKSELEKVSAEFIRIDSSEDVLPTLQRMFNDGNIKHIAISNEKEVDELSKSLVGITISKATEFEYLERKAQISQINTALIFADNGIADIGSVVFYYDNTETTYPHFLCDWSVILIKENTIVANQFELMKNINKEKAKNMVFVTGPSRTADIEKTLILGAHGPRRVTIVVIPSDDKC